LMVSLYILGIIAEQLEKSWFQTSLRHRVRTVLRFARKLS